MTQQIIKQNGRLIAVVQSDAPLIRDVSSALDLIASIRYAADCDRIAVNKQALSEDFFTLSTCLAGEILQRFINYQVKFAVFGDFSGYTSKPLRDFIRESNRGRDIFFTDTAEQAVERLAAH